MRKRLKKRGKTTTNFPPPPHPRLSELTGSRENWRKYLYWLHLQVEKWKIEPLDITEVGHDILGLSPDQSDPSWKWKHLVSRNYCRLKCQFLSLMCYLQLNYTYKGSVIKELLDLNKSNSVLWPPNTFFLSTFSF